MRIGIVTEYYYPTLGGIQEHVYHFAVEAMALGHAVRIITSNVRDIVDADINGHHDVPVIRVGLSLPVYANGSVGRITVGSHLGRALQRIFDREAFDVIHVHSPVTPILPFLSVTRSNTITVGTVHTNFNGSALLKIFRRKCRSLLAHLDGVIAVSKSAARALSPYLDSEYRIIPNGVDVTQFTPEQRAIAAFDDGKFNILWVGRMEPRNGLDRMIAAFVLATRSRPDLRLIVVGDGPLRATYEAMVPPSLRSAVSFLGAVNSERPAIYASADVLCNPATISSFGITLLEGMAAAKPIIASCIDGFSDVIADGREGLLIDTANPEIFADTILKLANDHPLAAALGERGRKTALTYAWPSVAAKVIDHYRELIERRKAAPKCPRGS